MVTNHDIPRTTVGLTITGYWRISGRWNGEYTANSMLTATESKGAITGKRTGARANGTAITITSKSANTDASIAKKTGMSMGKNAGKNAENMTRLIAGLHQKESAPENGCLPKVN